MYQAIFHLRWSETRNQLWKKNGKNATYPSQEGNAQNATKTLTGQWRNQKENHKTFEDK